MEKLISAIINSGETKQCFAEKTHIPFYRIAMILYKKDVLSDEEEKKIISVYGENIFFTLI